MIKKFERRFSGLFSDYLRLHNEESLSEIAALGNDLIQNNIPPEDIAEIFEESLNRYAQTVPEVRLGEISDRIAVPLVELLMSYGMAFRKQVHERRHLASKIIENTPEGIFMTNAESNILIANPSFSAITGYANTELIGKNLSFLLRLDKVGAAPENIFLMAERNGHWKGEITSRRKGGEPYRAVLNITAIRDGYGNVTDYVGILDDITEQKQQEEIFRLELSRAKKIYDMVVRPDLPMTKWAEITVKCLPAENFGGDTLDIIAPSENSLLIFLADVTGHGVSAAMTANTLKTMFREISAATLSPAAVCSRLNRTMSKTILPDDIIAAFCALLDVKTMTMTYCLAGLPNPMIFRDNEIIRLTPTGMPIGVFEETNYHEKIFALQENDVLLAFTDGVTEARNFRGEIFGLSGVEKSRPQPLPETDGSGGLGLTDAVLEGAIRFQNSLSFQDDLILLSMRVVRPHPLPLPGTDRGENSEHAMPLNSFHTERKSILTLETRYADIDSLIAGIMADIRKKMVLEAEDQGKLTIALFESIVNAIEHGNLELTEFRNDLKLQDAEAYDLAYQERRNSPRYGDRKLMIEVYYGMEEIEISVADEGNGFDVFAVPDPTITVNLDRPTGRGIYLLKKSADRVTYNSKGNKVTFFKKIKSQSMFEAGFSEIKDIRVLIVEDEPGVAEINRLMLEKSGYIVVGVAEDGQQAIEMVKTRMPDVILMDYMLPDMDGLEITKRIQEIYPTPVVMLTGYSGEELSEKAYLSGIGAYLSKPVRLHEISQAITVSMARFNDIKELRRINIQLQTEIAKREQSETHYRTLYDRQKRMEKSILDYTEFLQTLLETIPMPIFYKNTSGIYLGCNKAYEDFFGPLPRSGTEGVAPLSFSEEGCEVRSVKHADGSFREIEYHNALFSDNNGKTTGMIGVISDITEIRQAQTRKMEALGQLAEDLAFEFGNLLQVISGYAEIMIAEISPPHVMYEDIKEILKTSEKAGYLVNQLREFGRQQHLVNPKAPESDAIVHPFSYQPASFTKIRILLVEDNTHQAILISKLLKKAGYDVVGMAENGMQAIEMTQTLKPDVVIMDNKMPDMDGIEATRRISEICPTPVVMLTAYDMPDFLKQASKAGVGYYLLKPPDISQLVNAITIAMARFEDMEKLRRANEQLRSDRGLPNGVAVSPAMKTILLAEDETSARNMIVRFLKKAGYQIIEACDGEEAICIFEEHSDIIDLALLDIMMPNINGKEVADAIRASHPNIPIIFITGYDRDISESEHYEVIRKPCNMSVLLQKIRDVLLQENPVDSQN